VLANSNDGGCILTIINLILHSGAHPRMGVNDNLSLNSLGQATTYDAIWLTEVVASDIDNDLQGMPNPYRNINYTLCKEMYRKWEDIISSSIATRFTSQPNEYRQ
jgi:glutamate formiminotransferase